MIECLFSYNEKVKITKGFYRGYKGRVQEVIESKEEIKYKVKIEASKTPILVEEENLKPLFLGYL